MSVASMMYVIGVKSVISVVSVVHHQRIMVVIGVMSVRRVISVMRVMRVMVLVGCEYDGCYWC